MDLTEQEELQKQLAEISVNNAVLELGESIEDLHARLGGHRKAMQDRPHLEAERSQLHADAEALLKMVRPDLSLADGVYAGKLSEDGVKSMLTFRRGGTGGPEVRDASGSIRFWVKNGVLAKYQYTVKGTMTWNDNDMEMDRTTTVEISDIGSTQVELPEAAKEKLS